MAPPFKLPDRIVRDFQAAQRNFESIEGGLQNSLALAAAGTARKVAFGTDTVTFTAATLSAVKTITHGLGGTPVIAMATTLGATVFNCWFLCQTLGATTFDVFGESPVNQNGTAAFSWLAIA